MKAARPDAKPDDPLFTENHREGIKELLIKAKLRTDTDGRPRVATIPDEVPGRPSL
jgi:hypothetical protein